ncbi:MAG TPA: hypothetical protein VFM18_14730, partial [Methanosarcina sp.]|nr:hypothetical protein [Methanosarcina sp.]
MVKKESKVLTNEDKCRVISYYPILQLHGNAGRIDELNKTLEDINEMNRFAGNCASYFPAEYANKKKEIIGDYNILFDSDSILNIEFFTKSVGLSKIEYRNVFVDLKNWQLLEENKAIPNIERGKLYPY